MKKLIKMFKSLPPEMRMMIAMAGLGSPIGIIYALKRWFFPNTATFVLILYVVGAIAVICLLGWLVSKLFGRGKGKRANKMAADLAADADAGRSSMDVAAAIKENNQKFFGAISDMNKSVGLSVYDLPWYIVIGDSGCGKTKLINEGGLQFSLGKPEGYQLGTLNYNWWFTEDAVFVDMAGRLINPRDDADRKEWEAFLTTISKGRKGFPINGVVVCVAADHLLQDPPDRIEQDANTMLERLRDLQSRLGVTFATYVVITKCDKMVGFMQFFDRAERDIRVLNQMVGWSKPGEFNELYEPEEFPDQFDEVYRRLHELRLRRMNDDAEEIDLGLAYGFPEEFRELREPLHTYVRTLFPKIKNPRAIKNLLYRGLYFTSATREGGLILKHLTDRLGPEAAEQFQPLDIYPSKRPYFIRDFFFRKMFPEHGLVFRNEEQAVRNRKLAKVLKYGSVSLALLLIATAVLSIINFADVIDDPRQIATVQLVANEALPEPPTALANTRDLERFAADLSGSRWATILSLGLGTREPVQGLREIHAALFERVLLRRAIADVSLALRTKIPSAPIDEAAKEDGQAYLTALKHYVKWYACSGDEASGWQAAITKDSFKSMCAIVGDPQSPINSTDFNFLDHAGYYFDTLAQSDDPEDWQSPARMLSRNGEEPEKTIQLALDGGAWEYLKAFATLDSKNPNPIVREWMRIREACDAVAGRYQTMIGFAADGVEYQSSEDMETLKREFSTAFTSFETNLAEAYWKSETNMVELRTVILAMRKEAWVQYVQDLTTELAACGAAADSPVSGYITGLQLGANKIGLDQHLWNQLRDAGLTEKLLEDVGFDDEVRFHRDVRELYTPYDHIIRYDGEGNTNQDKLKLTADAQTVRGILEEIRDAFNDANLSPDNPPGKPSDWKARFDETLEPDASPDSTVGDADFDSLEPKWSPDRLADLYVEHERLIYQGSIRAILETVRVGLTDLGPLGLAALEPGAGDLKSSAYYIDSPEIEHREVEVPSPSRTTEPRKKKRKPRFKAPSLFDSPQSSQSAPTGTAIRSGEGKVPQWAQRGFHFDRAFESYQLLFVLDSITPDFFLTSADDEEVLNRWCARLLRQAAEQYDRAYVRAWSAAYEDKTLPQLDELVGESRDWDSLTRSLKKRVAASGMSYQAVRAELKPALGEILESIPFWGHQKSGSKWVSPHSSNRPSWSAVAEWMRSAIGEEWSQDHGVFAVNARIPPIQGIAQKEPWEAIAEAFARKWEDFGQSIANVEPFPEKFLAKKRPAKRIRWPDFDALRHDTQLTDDRLTGKLLKFESMTQEALSAEITRILVDVQERRLASTTEVGWPFSGEKDVGTNLYKTVEFPGFRDFIREVRNAEVYFMPLEEGLPDTATTLARRRFYDRCHLWYRFLGLSETDPTSTKLKPLEIERASYFDPMDENAPATNVNIDITGPNYYGMVELTLGLKVKEEGDTVPVAKALKISTSRRAQTQKNWQARWEWDAQGPMTFKLTHGAETGSGTTRYKPVSKSLGTCTPLSICAYLLDGNPLNGDRSTWITAHAMNLPEKLRGVGQPDLASKVEKRGHVQVGLGFRFKLDRPMPEPIAELKLASE